MGFLRIVSLLIGIAGFGLLGYIGYVLVVLYDSEFAPSGNDFMIIGAVTGGIFLVSASIIIHVVGAWKKRPQLAFVEADDLLDNSGEPVPYKRTGAYIFRNVCRVVGILGCIAAIVGMGITISELVQSFSYDWVDPTTKYFPIGIACTVALASMLTIVFSIRTWNR